MMSLFSGVIILIDKFGVKGNLGLSIVISYQNMILISKVSTLRTWK
jgi:hypothetical protein